MDFRSALSFLSRYTNYERALRYPYDGWAMNLERMAALLAALGRPERRFPVIQVAGTKGKGSTAAMIAAILSAAGRRAGLYTSPHLTDFRERIRIDGALIGEDAVAEGVARLEPAVRAVEGRPGLGPVTYFELLTALALDRFAAAGVDAAVLEAGLGGRYDATTAADPVVAVVTGISYDHTDILGDTLAAIAAEKAMIIKPGGTAVLAPQPEEAAAVLLGRCRETGAPCIRVEESYRWERQSESPNGQRFSLTGTRSLPRLFVPLAGDHQLVNAATAVTALDAAAPAGFSVPDAAVEQGLAALSWPARFQRVRTAPDVILDGAHNAASAAALRDTLLRLYPGRRITAVLGLGADKDVEGFCRELAPALGSAVLTRSSAAKSAEPGRIRAALGGVPAREAPDVAGALAGALAGAAADEVVVVTGSFYVIAEAVAALSARDFRP